jgi:hypothetical protein
MKQFIKDCKSYDSCFSSSFHTFLQCLLDAEVSQIHVYFLHLDVTSGLCSTWCGIGNIKHYVSTIPKIDIPWRYL